MSIPLILEDTTGRKKELSVAEILEADIINRLNTSGDLAIGVNLDAADEIALGNVAGTSVVHILGDTELDGSLQFVEGAAPGTPAATLGVVYMKTGDDGIFFKPDTGVEVDLTATSGGGGETLQQTYDFGNTITIAAATSLQLTTASGVTVDPIFGITTVGAGVGNAIRLNMVAAWAGNGLDVNFDSTNINARAILIDTAAGVLGKGLQIDHNATGSGADAIHILMDSAAAGAGIRITHGAAIGTLMLLENSVAEMFQVLGSGEINIDGNSGQNVQITSEGAGNVAVAAFGSGDVAVQAVGAGNVDINAQGGGDLNLQEGGANRIVILAAGGITATPASGQDFNVDANGAGSIILTSNNTFTITSDADAINLTANAALTLQSTTDEIDMLSTVNLNDQDILNAKTVTFGASPETQTTVGASTTIDWRDGQKQHLNLDETTTTLAFTDPLGIGNFTLVVQQTGGSFEITGWDADIIWLGGTPPTFLDASGSFRLISFYFDGTRYFGEFNDETYS